MLWWSRNNPLPDGFQNEYLHVGNALDLWGALCDRDLWHMRWYMYTSYWPWGFYAAAWPFLAALGPVKQALLLSNVLYLAVLLWATHAIGKETRSPLTPVLVALCPGVFGTLVRFEPNFAAIAWTAAGLACLIRSKGLTYRREVIGFGFALGIGLMLDRLTVAFFLIPALIPLLKGANKTAWKNLLIAMVTTLVLTAAYYREFFQRYTQELLSQAPVGEIDSAGAVSVTGGGNPWSYYIWSLLDSQAGLILGAIMLWGTGAAIKRSLAAVRPSKPSKKGQANRNHDAVLLWAIIPPILLFSLIAKKQVFYTLPILVPMAVFAGQVPKASWVGVAAGLWSFLALGVGSIPSPPVLMGPGHQFAHTLARPPSFQDWGLQGAIEAMGPQPAGTDRASILVFSQVDALYEGFITLAIRETYPDSHVRGLRTDPNGTYELLHETPWFLLVGPPNVDWPAKSTIDEALLANHAPIDAMPPMARLVASSKEDFDEIGRWNKQHPNQPPIEIVLFRRRPLE